MKRALVVDDTKNIRLLLGKCLEMEGFNVNCASDGQEAVDILTSQDFDLIFLDIKLPHISGTEVLSRIRENGIKTPVIIITAYATVKNAVECTQMGAVAYLQKPFTVNKIRNVLSEIKCEAMPKPSQTDELKTQARQLIDIGQYEKAIGLLKSALSDSPLDAEIYLILSDVYHGLGGKEETAKFKKLYESLKDKIE